MAEHTNDSDDFERTEPELKLSKELNSEVVDGYNGDQEYSDPGGNHEQAGVLPRYLGPHHTPGLTLSRSIQY